MSLAALQTRQNLELSKQSYRVRNSTAVGALPYLQYIVCVISNVIRLYRCQQHIDVESIWFWTSVSLKYIVNGTNLMCSMDMALPI